MSVNHMETINQFSPRLWITTSKKDAIYSCICHFFLYGVSGSEVQKREKNKKTNKSQNTICMTMVSQFWDLPWKLGKGRLKTIPGLSDGRGGKSTNSWLLLTEMASHRWERSKLPYESRAKRMIDFLRYMMYLLLLLPLAFYMLKLFLQAFKNFLWKEKAMEMIGNNKFPFEICSYSFSLRTF